MGINAIGRMAQSSQWLATGWSDRGPNAGGGRGRDFPDPSRPATMLHRLP